jgi:hypothetical protein
MAMITDAIAAHPDGVRALAENARAADDSEAEIPRRSRSDRGLAALRRS